MNTLQGFWTSGDSGLPGLLDSLFDVTRILASNKAYGKIIDIYYRTWSTTHIGVHLLSLPVFQYGTLYSLAELYCLTVVTPSARVLYCVVIQIRLK
jgi:hypothetical protein